MNLNLLFLMMNLTFSNEILKIFYKINRNIKKTIIFYLNITKYLLNRYISMINIVSCKFDRIKPFYTIVELIENRKQADFTNCLCRAAKSGSKEICTYIINQMMLFLFFWNHYIRTCKRFGYLDLQNGKISIFFFSQDIWS